MKNRANVDFLTNTAVAWFAAGIIAPIFNKPKSLLEFLPYTFAAIFAGFFMYLANHLERRKRG